MQMAAKLYIPGFGSVALVLSYSDLLALGPILCYFV